MFWCLFLVVCFDVRLVVCLVVFDVICEKELKGKAVVFLEPGTSVHEKAMLGAGCIVGGGEKTAFFCLFVCVCVC